MVAPDEPLLAAPRPRPGGAGRGFWKMSGSGNDFVFLDGRVPGVGAFETPEAIGRLCSRTEGVGADGVVVIAQHPVEPFSIRYFNRDGSRGELCGNASLCSSRLAVMLGLADPAAFRFCTDVGTIAGRIVGNEAELDLPAAHGLQPDADILAEAGERRIGFVDTGVPHLVVLTDDANSIDLMRRGAALRRHKKPHGRRQRELYLARGRSMAYADLRTRRGRRNARMRYWRSRLGDRPGGVGAGQASSRATHDIREAPDGVCDPR